MKKKITLAAVCVLAVLAFAGIYFLYNNLSSSYAPTVMPEAVQQESSVTEASSGDVSDSDIPQTYAAPFPLGRESRQEGASG